jgi:hypothetical protein
MPNPKLLSALLLAVPALLLAGGCSAEVKTSPAPSKATTKTSTAAATLSDLGDPAQDEGEGDHQDADHDGHDHDVAAATPPVAKTSLPAQATPEEHGPDDGHDHDTPSGAINNPPVLGDGLGPRLVYPVGGESHSFGRVMEGTVAEHTFELTNDGSEDLIIKQIKPTCGCTVAQVQVQGQGGEMVAYTFGDAIKPKTKVHFPAKLHTKGKTGHQTTRINVFSNDPRGTIQLGLEADIDPFFSIAPQFINFGQVSVGDVINKKAVISTSKGTPMGLTLVEQSLPGGAECELTPVDPDGEGRAARWDLSVTLGPDLVEGNLARAINFQSDVAIPGTDPVLDGANANYGATITLSAQVVGPFSYNPPYLSMGLVRPGQVATRTVTIESHDEGFSFAESMPEIRVVGLQNPAIVEGGETTFREWEYADRFTPTIRPVEGKNAVEIELRLEGMPDSATGSFRGTLLVDLNHPDKKQIQLVVTGVCRGGPAASK